MAGGASLKARFIRRCDGEAEFAATPMGQRQICSGGSIGKGVIRRMKTARACVHSAEGGQPPARHKRMAQSTAYASARSAVVSAMPRTAAADVVNNRLIMLCPHEVDGLLNNSSGFLIGR